MRVIRFSLFIALLISVLATSTVALATANQEDTEAGSSEPCRDCGSLMVDNRSDYELQQQKAAMAKVRDLGKMADSSEGTSGAQKEQKPGGG